ncbi:hypothetical protein F0562_027167 [Nyssa sinensis]|uniref:Uncharacterized protein n=1 Tax=Nyssa sinensis TaxID=561372 RepID=A0A5J5B495_9ASTE|nr:hypothetical protein F0562_027167 [Nyssa sinensis]
MPMASVKLQVMHMVFMTTMIIITMMLMSTASASSSSSELPSSPLPSPAFLHFNKLKDQSHRELEHYDQIQPAFLEEDYGFWDPAPYYGGGEGTRSRWPFYSAG